MENLLTQDVGFIGAGHLTRAMVFGLVQAGYPMNQIWLSNRSQGKLDFYQSQGIYTTTDNNELVFNSNLIVLATRPKDMLSMLEGIEGTLTDEHLVISVAAGLGSDMLMNKMNANQSFVRAMPNTPSSVQMAMTGLWANEHSSDYHKLLAEELFNAMGKILWLKNEKQMHALTAISGCGPAYFLEFMQNMVETGIKMGLSEDDVKTLTLQTAKGAAQMAEVSNEALAELVNQIALPGGVTAEAIKVFRENGLKQLTEKAIFAAKNKSRGYSI